MSMTISANTASEKPAVTLEGSAVITGVLSGLPPCESGTTVVRIDGGDLLPGTPMSLPGSTLPANYKWADRSAVLFADWPELRVVYDAGLLDVLPAEATDEERAANPRKWVLNGCGNGLFLPDIGGRFAREWRPGQTDDAGRAAGTRQGDAIRNIVGEVRIRTGVPLDEAGCFYSGPMAKISSSGQAVSVPKLQFDASRVVPTADENRPLNDAQPVAIYMGRRAQDLQ